MKTMLRSISLSLLWLSCIACSAGQSAQSSTPTPTNPTPVTPSIVEPTPVTPPVASSTEPALIWERRTETGESSEDICEALVITAEGQPLIGPCGAAQKPVRFLANHQKEWSEILARFAPFETSISNERLVFRGQGQVAGQAWQRAIATWAGFTHDELEAGRVGAAVRTVMSWWLGPVPGRPGYCAHLVVLSYGYAYRSIAPCQGGADEQLGEGWVETEPWQQFDAWLYNRAAVYQDNNYFAGLGGQQMTGTEIAQLSQWAKEVYESLAN